MEQAKQELKNLMNEMFVEDLKTKADELLTGMATQFQGAVDEFTREYNSLIDDAAERVIEPKMKLLNETITNASDLFETRYNKLLDEINITKIDFGEKYKTLQDKNTTILNSLTDQTDKVVSEVSSGFIDEEINNLKRLETINNAISDKSDLIVKTVETESQKVAEKVDDVSVENEKRKKDIKDTLSQNKSYMDDKITNSNQNNISLITSIKEELSAKTNKTTILVLLLGALTIIETIILFYYSFVKL